MRFATLRLLTVKFKC